MRIVGKLDWQEIAVTPKEAVERGAHLDAMARLPGIPDFQPRGLFRGTHAYFQAMDEDKARKRQAWLLEHAIRPD